MKFSQRIGITPITDTLQTEGMDERLTIRLWNNISSFLERLDADSKYLVSKYIWCDYLVKSLDRFPLESGFYLSEFQSAIKPYFFDSNWYDKYDFLEYTIKMSLYFKKTNLVEKCNNSLQKENAGYKVINGIIVPVVDKEEVQSIEEAINHSSSPVKTHLNTALQHLANRENPDYRNSIKESISAIEAICKELIGDNNVTLGQALKKIDKKQEIHPALKGAFSSLYGYTNDSGGIRHGLTSEDHHPTLEEARFMLITCSAFINYLQASDLD